MNKIATLTFQSAMNYGAVLQCYGLYRYLSNNFGETCVLDYHNEYIDSLYVKPLFSTIFSNPKSYISNSIRYNFSKKKNMKIESFCKNKIGLTIPYNKNNIEQSNKEFKYFVVGSDQVWNPLIISDDNNYFLQFVNSNNIKCSYAASIGVSELDNKEQERFKNLLSDFKSVSIRESASENLVNNIYKNKVSVNVDPTLLVDINHWKNISITPKEKDYILLYKITKSNKLFEFAKKLSEKTGKKIILIPNDYKDIFMIKNKIVKKDIGVEEWLGYILHADYVVTNSFHGTVFSILFNKDFYSEVSNKVNPSTNRLLSLLNAFNMNSHIINDNNDILDKFNDDYNNTLNVIEEGRKKTDLYFKEVFEI